MTLNFFKENVLLVSNYGITTVAFRLISVDNISAVNSLSVTLNGLFGSNTTSVPFRV